MRGRRDFLKAGLGLGLAVWASGPAWARAPGADLRFDPALWDASLQALVEQPVPPELAAAIEEAQLQVAAPPANESMQTRLEIEQLIGLARTERTEARVAAIRVQNTGLATDHLPWWGDPMKVGGAIGLGNRLTDELGLVLLHEKARFMRPRPSVLAAAQGRVIEPVVAVPGHPAYPSAYAGQAWVLGLFYAQLDPANRDEYLRLAYEMGWLREVAGVNYRSDSEAGRQLAQRYFEYLTRQPVYRQTLEALGFSEAVL